MDIYFSRHAKRRGRLYGISEDTVRSIFKNKELIQGNQELIEYNVKGFNSPIKIVFTVENDIITVVTNYPLKKG